MQMQMAHWILMAGRKNFHKWHVCIRRILLDTCLSRFSAETVSAKRSACSSPQPLVPVGEMFGFILQLGKVSDFQWISMDFSVIDSRIFRKASLSSGHHSSSSNIILAPHSFPSPAEVSDWIHPGHSLCAFGELESIGVRNFEGRHQYVFWPKKLNISSIETSNLPRHIQMLSDISDSEHVRNYAKLWALLWDLLHGVVFVIYIYMCVCVYYIYTLFVLRVLGGFLRLAFWLTSLGCSCSFWTPRKHPRSERAGGSASCRPSKAFPTARSGSSRSTLRWGLPLWHRP